MAGGDDWTFVEVEAAAAVRGSGRWHSLSNAEPTPTAAMRGSGRWHSLSNVEPTPAAAARGSGRWHSLSNAEPTPAAAVRGSGMWHSLSNAEPTPAAAVRGSGRWHSLSNAESIPAAAARGSGRLHSLSNAEPTPAAARGSGRWHTQLYDGNTARLACRSDEALGVHVSVARIAPSHLDLGRGRCDNAGEGKWGRVHASAACLCPTLDCYCSANKTITSMHAIFIDAAAYSWERFVFPSNLSALHVSLVEHQLGIPSQKRGYAHATKQILKINSQEIAEIFKFLAPSVSGAHKSTGGSISETARRYAGKVRLEQRRNVRAGESGYPPPPREGPPTSSNFRHDSYLQNQPTSGIVWHESHMRKSGSDTAGECTENLNSFAWPRAPLGQDDDVALVFSVVGSYSNLSLHSDASGKRGSYSEHINLREVATNFAARTRNTNVLRVGEGEASVETQERGEWDIPEETRRQAASSGTIPKFENPKVTPSGIQPSLLS
ncbi:hypothetical protein PR048_019446 [Dryococelus australis]|uniref:Uncharacterized protein n=1 Tax=Dryococelus australis TaxID=614101 RepID=A0ABQ9H3L2_9NEOP|nr:hypothetical protein PR048_019446 [Dryococelus australis]